MTATVASGLCMCGCGQETPIAKRTRPYLGHVAGQPTKFVQSHSLGWVGRKHSTATKARISAAKYRGGSKISEGRRYVRVPLGHPMRANTGYVGEHRLLVAEALGRMLSPTEHVHHINLDQTDNRIENLIVLSPSQHSRLHKQVMFHGVDPITALIDICKEDTPAWHR